MKRGTWILLAVILLWPQTAWADAATKLGRGIMNTAFGWFEIVNEIGNEADRRGPWVGVPSGLVRGIALGVGRTVVGVLEVVSFPFPNGERGYDPLMRPETVFDRR